MIDWEVKPDSFHIDSELIETLVGFTYSLRVERRHLFYVAKVIIPLVLIMAMSWVVFWMDPKEGGGAQIGISVTAILTLIAYTFAAGASLPKVPYLTRLDYFILSSTVLVFLALVEATVSSYQARKGRVEFARSIDRWSRWLFPSVFLLMTIMSLGFRLFL